MNESARSGDVGPHVPDIGLPIPVVRTAMGRALAAQLPRYGYKRLYRRLRKQGVIVNHKKVYRIYREEGLMVRKRARKRLVRRNERPAAPSQPNERWSMDFTSDQLSAGPRFRTFNVVDAARVKHWQST